ncbi:MAG: hypothetical protein ACXAEU_07775 [Candidatus Hodarchaeales archaeon]|jgi:hypothetical protein
MNNYSYPVEEMRLWELEGTLFSCIATLDKLSLANDQGEVDQDIFSRQLRALLKHAMKTRIFLEEKGFLFDKFIEVHEIEKKYSRGLSVLKRVEGSEGTEKIDEAVGINYAELKKLPTKAADFVAASIELMDLLRLKAIATVDRIIPLLDELEGVLNSLPILGEDYWALQEITRWKQSLNKQKPGTILDDKKLDSLELQAVRWLNDFRRKMKDI